MGENKILLPLNSAPFCVHTGPTNEPQAVNMDSHWLRTETNRDWMKKRFLEKFCGGYHLESLYHTLLNGLDELPKCAQ